MSYEEIQHTPFGCSRWGLPITTLLDSINSQNTIRFGLNNPPKTKRDNQIEYVSDWDVMMD